MAGKDSGLQRDRKVSDKEEFKTRVDIDLGPGETRVVDVHAKGGGGDPDEVPISNVFHILDEDAQPIQGRMTLRKPDGEEIPLQMTEEGFYTTREVLKGAYSLVMRPDKKQDVQLRKPDLKIAFAPGSSELDANARLAIDQLMTYMRGLPPHNKNSVRLVGYSSGAGSSTSNMLLSQKRASAVSAELEKRNLAAVLGGTAILIPEGKKDPPPKKDPPDPKDPPDKVEVEVEQKEPRRKPSPKPNPAQNVPDASGLPATPAELTTLSEREHFFYESATSRISPVGMYHYSKYWNAPYHSYDLGDACAWNGFLLTALSIKCTLTDPETPYPANPSGGNCNGVAITRKPKLREDVLVYLQRLLSFYDGCFKATTNVDAALQAERVPNWARNGETPRGFPQTGTGQLCRMVIRSDRLNLTQYNENPQMGRLSPIRFKPWWIHRQPMADDWPAKLRERAEKQGGGLGRYRYVFRADPNAHPPLKRPDGSRVEPGYFYQYDISKDQYSHAIAGLIYCRHLVPELRAEADRILGLIRAQLNTLIQVRNDDGELKNFILVRDEEGRTVHEGDFTLTWYNPVLQALHLALGTNSRNAVSFGWLIALTGFRPGGYPFRWGRNHYFNELMLCSLISARMLDNAMTGNNSERARLILTLRNVTEESGGEFNAYQDFLASSVGNPGRLRKGIEALLQFPHTTWRQRIHAPQKSYIGTVPFNERPDEHNFWEGSPYLRGVTIEQGDAAFGRAWVAEVGGRCLNAHDYLIAYWMMYALNHARQNNIAFP